MTAWGSGMRLRVAISFVFCTSLGVALLIQSPQRNSALAHRLRFGWTPEMLGWVLLVLGLMTGVAVLVQHVPLAGVMSAMSGIVFVALTLAVWPKDGESYWFPIFTLHAVANQFASLLILGKDWSRR